MNTLWHHYLLLIFCGIFGSLVGVLPATAHPSSPAPSILEIDQKYHALLTADILLQDRLPLAKAYLEEVAANLETQNVALTYDLIGRQEKGLRLRILPGDTTPYNRLAAVLARDRFPLLFSAYRNLTYHDAAHKFFNADLGSSAFYVGTWFLNHPRHLDLKVLANTTAAIHYYQQRTPNFIKYATLTTAGLDRLPPAQAKPYYRRYVLQKNPPIYLSQALKISTKFWDLWGSYFNLYFLLRRFATAVTTHKKRHPFIITEATHIFYKLLAHSAYRLLDLHVIFHTLQHQPELVNLEILPGSSAPIAQPQQVKITLTPLDQISDFSFTLTLPLTPTENPATPEDIFHLQSTKALYMFFTELHRQLRQMRFAIDHLPKSTSVHLADLTAKAKSLAQLPQRITQDALTYDLLSTWTETLAIQENMAQHSAAVTTKFYKELHHSKKRITCASLLSARNSPWIKYLQEFFAPPKMQPGQ